MSQKTVLVVDDEIHIVHVVAIKLRNNGYYVITAENGQDAYNKALAQTPDLIITDYQMPVMTGIEMIEKLRSTEGLCDIPVIMLTARNFAIEEDVRSKLKISHCLSKPFSPKDLLRSVEDVIYENSVSTNS